VELIETALEGKELPPEDYPVCVIIGAEGTWTPTGLAGRLEMPLTTVPSACGASNGAATQNGSTTRVTAARSSYS